MSGRVGLLICMLGAGADGIEGTGWDGWKGMIFLRNFRFLVVIVLEPSTLTV